MSTKSVLLSWLMLFCVSSAFSCLNESDDKIPDDYGLYFSWSGLHDAFKKDLKKEGLQKEATLRGSTKFHDRNDYAVALIFLGRNREAVELLEKLEAEQPGHYFVAANLGTAYELSGNNAKALKWINEGIRRNPQDHQGTEWLHARILEAKIAAEKDHAFFEKHSVLELQPGSNEQQFSVAGKIISAEELVKAIQYQLGERLKFVKPRDPVVASLLFDYATIAGTPQTIEAGKLILKMAGDYGYPAAKVAALKQRLDRRLVWENSKRYAGYALIGIVSLALGVWLYKLRGVVLPGKRLQPT